MRRGERASCLRIIASAVACVASSVSAHAGHDAQGAPSAVSAPAVPAPAVPPLTGPAAPLDDPSATADQRMAALDALAAGQGTHPLLALMARARPMPMRDLRVRQYVAIAAALGQKLAHPVPAEVASSLLSEAANADAPVAQVIAIRAIDAIPESARPEGAARFAVTRIALATVPSRMVYDTAEFSVTAGTPVCITMSNPDTLQHNLLVVAPRALSEIGIAGDKMGETAAGKACHFTPDSPKVLAVMGLVDPGATGEVWFVAPAKPATYPYVCTYPGHWRMMNGKMKVTAPATPKGDSKT
jgi:azurin